MPQVRVVSIVLWGCALTAGPVGVPAGEPVKLQVRTAGFETYRMQPGQRLWSNRPYQATQVPSEWAGALAIRGPLDKAGARLAVAVDRPARCYGLLRWLWIPEAPAAGRLPAGWKLYAPEAFPLEREHVDVFYRDLPAGEHVLEIGGAFAIVGVKAAADLEPSEACVPFLRAPDARYLVAPGTSARLIAGAEGLPDAAKLACQWKLLDAAGRPVRSGQVEIAAESPLEVGPLAEGLWTVDAEFAGAGCTWKRRVRLAAFQPSPPDETTAEPFFPFGAYHKYNGSPRPELADAYFAATCQCLRRHGLNALVAAEATVGQMDLARQFHVRVIRGLRRTMIPEVLSHPALGGVVVGDEPMLEHLPDYQASYEAMAKAAPGKPVMTCLVGESTGLGLPNDPIPIWDGLRPAVRVARYYPFRKAGYDLLHGPTYKGWLPISDAFTIFAVRYSTPWWYVAQSFGGNPTPAQPDPYWRNPTPAELAGSIHLALAFGAKGVLCWTLQTHWNQAVCLVRQETLEPEDGKLAALGQLARRVLAARQTLVQLQFGGCEVRSDRFEVLAVPLHIGQGSSPEAQAQWQHFVYVVNRDTRTGQEADLTAVTPPGQKPARQVLNVFDGSRVDLKPMGRHVGWHLRLGPGDGQLWRLEL